MLAACAVPSDPAFDRELRGYVRTMASAESPAAESVFVLQRVRDRVTLAVRWDDGRISRFAGRQYAAGSGLVLDLRERRDKMVLDCWSTTVEAHPRDERFAQERCRLAWQRPASREVDVLWCRSRGRDGGEIVLAPGHGVESVGVVCHVGCLVDLYIRGHREL